jgi:hypothetical protein
MGGIPGLNPGGIGIPGGIIPGGNGIPRPGGGSGIPRPVGAICAREGPPIPGIGAARPAGGAGVSRIWWVDVRDMVYDFFLVVFVLQLLQVFFSSLWSSSIA